MLRIKDTNAKPPGKDVQTSTPGPKVIDVNFTDKYGRTAPYIAADRSDKPMVINLLSYTGINVNVIYYDRGIPKFRLQYSEAISV